MGSMENSLQGRFELAWIAFAFRSRCFDYIIIKYDKIICSEVK